MHCMIDQSENLENKSEKENYADDSKNEDQHDFSYIASLLCRQIGILRDSKDFCNGGLVTAPEIVGDYERGENDSERNAPPAN